LYQFAEIHLISFMNLKNHLVVCYGLNLTHSLQLFRREYCAVYCCGLSGNIVMFCYRLASVLVSSIPGALRNKTDRIHVTVRSYLSNTLSTIHIMMFLWKIDIKENGILICWPIIVGPSRGMFHRRNIAENRHLLLSRSSSSNPCVPNTISISRNPHLEVDNIGPVGQEFSMLASSSEVTWVYTRPFVGTRVEGKYYSFTNMQFSVAIFCDCIFLPSSHYIHLSAKL
ncbi:hypothetical protein L9F63_019785, partial [Diploptera punctata]